MTGLPNAASNGDLVEIRRLLAAGADVNETDWGGRTALYRAALGGHLGCLRLLLLQDGVQLDRC